MNAIVYKRGPSLKMYILTWRERIVRTNRTAATTRYFSLLCVNNKTLSITLFRRKLHLQKEKNPAHLYVKHQLNEVNSQWLCEQHTIDYFILYGWWRTQKHSNSHMFDNISGFVPFWFPIPPPDPTDLPLDWATASKGQDAVITSISWPKCFS